MIISIDGPAGSGKSTAARKLAAVLEVPYLDTGAMYRALAYWALHEGVNRDDPRALLHLARTVSMEVDCGPTHTRVKINGHDVTEMIRTLEVSRATSAVARHPGIRELMVEAQRALARKLGTLVTEGRDQGSVVFPHADVKFVLEASLERRAERRLDEMRAEGEDVSAEEVLANLKSRDETDSMQWAPLLQPGQAIRIDTTTLTMHQVVDCLREHVERVREARSEAEQIRVDERR